MAAFSSILWFLLIGGLAGWLAGLLVRGAGFGLLANILIGAVGAVLGGTLVEEIGVDAGEGFLGQLGTALLGALVLLVIAGVASRLLRR